MSFDSIKINSLLSCNRYETARDVYPIHNKGRRFTGLIYTAAGREVYRYRDKTITAEPETVLFNPKGSEYRIDFDVEVSLCYGFELDVADTDGLVPTLFTPAASFGVEGLFLDAIRIWNAQKVGCLAECTALLYKTIAALQKSRELIIHPAVFEKIRPAVEYLHEHYTDRGFRVDELHVMAGLDAKYFRTLFLRKYGISPKAYVTGLKIRRAKELLSTEKQNITEIADYLGYADVYHFSKAFKLATGVPPSGWGR